MLLDGKILWDFFGKWEVDFEKVENFSGISHAALPPRLLGADGEVNIGGSLRREG